MLNERDLIDMTVRVVAGFVSHNTIAAAELPALIQRTHATLSELCSQPFRSRLDKTPAVPIGESVTRDYIVCLDDGRRLKTLKRYLQRKYALTPEQYRARWRLPDDYPMVAPGYAELRSALARRKPLAGVPDPCNDDGLPGTGRAGDSAVAEQQQAWVSLSSADLHVEINPLGAQLSVLRDRAGHDLPWDGDPAVWNGRAPILFPIVGAVAGGSYRLGEKTYHLPRHGFARGRVFEVVTATATGATFRLTADDATLQIYPFHFELDVHFALSGATLTVTTSVRNTGSASMPASIGYHPAFRWPLPYGQPRPAHFIEFASDEPAPIRRLDANGLLAPEPHPTPVANRRLRLEDALFRDDVVIFDEFRSRSVTYGAADGPRIRVSYPNAAYLGLWTKPGANFICIEPWRGIADPAGFSGDFTAKPGVFTVAPGEAQSIEMAITLSGT